jgi:N-carbamoylputrescine amidase
LKLHLIKLEHGPPEEIRVWVLERGVPRENLDILPSGPRLYNVIRWCNLHRRPGKPRNQNGCKEETRQAMTEKLSNTSGTGPSSTSPFTIGIIQMQCSADTGANLQQAIARVREAAAKGAQIICLPELFRSPYFCTRETTELFALAESVPGESTEAFTALARELEVAIVVPVFERRAPGVYHNSAVVIDADGSVLGTYRKMHIPDDPLFFEKYYFAPGDAVGEHRGFKVFQTRYATIGVLICWDQWYPEGARITALLGAEVLFFPTAIGWHPAEKATFGEKQADAWETIQRSHAIANGVFVASPNRCGFEATPGTDGLEFFGRSFIADPFGKILAKNTSQEPEVLVVECDRSQIEYTRQNWPFLRDRRIDAYSPILARYLAKP